MPILKYSATRAENKQNALLHFALFGGMVRTYPHNGRKVPVIQRNGKHYYKYLGVPGVKRTNEVAKVNVPAPSVDVVKDILKRLNIGHVWR